MNLGTVDLAIIGGGQAGIPLAWAAARQGATVVLIEKYQLGGSCVNFGCTPTKAAIASAKVAQMARRAKEYGVNVGTVEVDYGAVLARARGVAAASRNGLDNSFEGSANPKLIRGHGRLDGREGDFFRIKVGDDSLLAKQVVLNTGTSSELPDIDGVDPGAMLNAENWHYSEDRPTHIAMVGGSYIAMEMAQFYRRLGIEVTVIARSEVLKHEDPDVSSAMCEVLKKEGVRFELNASIHHAEKNRNGYRLTIQEQEKTSTLDVSHIFAATGRKPNTGDVGLDTVGLEMMPDRTVRVTTTLATSVPGIWAAGDIRGHGQFTHTSWDDHRILVSQLFGDRSRTTDRVLPYAIFTDPELGRVGITQREAEKSDMQTKTVRFDMSRSGKAAELGETTGFIKVTINQVTREIVGAAVLTANGSELVHTYID
ncbi:MAG TPA: FAD-dependent oxidoreductase, partial [Bryobacteraceae bacterium]|nr:FAD-dependent oxidoreductase [Bryobacteraceae bacterium]